VRDNLIALQQREHDLNARLDALATLIETENRPLTAEERAERDAIMAELPGLRSDIAFVQERRREIREAPGAVEEQTGRVVSQTALVTPFASLGDQLIAVRQAAMNPHRPDPRLLDIQAAVTGASEGVASDGGFAVQTDFSTELLREVHQASVLVSRTRRVPISTNANGLKINGVDETSRVNGSRWGGVQAYWTAEGGTLTGTKPKYRQIALELNKLTALYYATDELIQDAAALGAAAGMAFTEEMAFKVDDALIRGTGAGMPLGIVGHAGTVSIAKETNQPAATILRANLEKMFAQIFASSIPRAEWYMNQDVWPALFSLTAEVGVGGVPVFIPPGGLSAAPFGLLLGRPITPIEQAATLGTVGDIIFADWDGYITIDKGGIAQASSLHVAFLTDEECFRWILRFDGQPIRNSTLTPAQGTKAQSAFVTLATRA
jgi:HK97 family phage major capsid protein